MTVNARLRSVLASEALSRGISAVFPTGVPSRAGRILVRDQAVDRVTAAELFFRLYERHELALIRDTMLSGWDVLELGAGIGVTGATVARRLRGTARVVCVEANADLLPTLKVNLDRHRGQTDISIVHGALGYADQPVRFLRSAAHTRSRIDLSLEDAIEVPTYTLSELLELAHLDDFILISDVEGAEGAMLTHDKDALRRCRQIIIELHGSGSQVNTMVRDISALGLKMVAARKTIFSFVRRTTET